MAVNSEQELIWQGRLHLGDEPGIYGDAAYTGICAELPITISRAEPTAEHFWLALDTSNLKTFNGYPGHQVSVIMYEDDPTLCISSAQSGQMRVKREEILLNAL